MNESLEKRSQRNEESTQHEWSQVIVTKGKPDQPDLVYVEGIDKPPIEVPHDLGDVLKAALMEPNQPGHTDANLLAKAQRIARGLKGH